MIIRRRRACLPLEFVCSAQPQRPRTAAFRRKAFFETTVVGMHHHHHHSEKEVPPLAPHCACSAEALPMRVWYLYLHCLHPDCSRLTLARALGRTLVCLRGQCQGEERYPHPQPSRHDDVCC